MGYDTDYETRFTRAYGDALYITERISPLQSKTAGIVASLFGPTI